MRRGDIVRVVQLGRAGHRFQHQAFARVHDPSVDDAQVGIKFMLVARQDVDAMTDSGNYLNAFDEDAVYSAPESHLARASENETAAVQAAWVLRGNKLVITSEPVSLAN